MTPVVVVVGIVCPYGYSEDCVRFCHLCGCKCMNIRWMKKWKCCCSIDYWILIAGAAF